jgi:hypothetical protein
MDEGWEGRGGDLGRRGVSDGGVAESASSIRDRLRQRADAKTGAERLVAHAGALRVSASDGGALGALPVGWREWEDKQGQAYYHNEQTRQTLWTRPTDNKGGGGYQGGSVESSQGGVK